MQVPFEDDRLLGGIEESRIVHTVQCSAHSADCHIFPFVGILLMQRDRIEILAERVTPPPLGRVAATDEVLE